MMKPRIRKIRLVVFLLIVAFLLGCNQKREKKVQLSPGMEQLTWNDSISFESNPLKKKIRSVAYLQPDAINQTMRPYIYYIKNYPEVGFIFIFGSNGEKTTLDAREKEIIKKKLKRLKFPIPVFIDADNKYHKNTAFIAFLVNENDVIKKVVNPSMPQYEDLLKDQLE